MAKGLVAGWGIGWRIPWGHPDQCARASALSEQGHVAQFNGEQGHRHYQQDQPGQGGLAFFCLPASARLPVRVLRISAGFGHVNGLGRGQPGFTL